MARTHLPTDGMYTFLPCNTSSGRASDCCLTGIHTKHISPTGASTRDYVVQLNVHSQWQAAVLTGLNLEAGMLLKSVVVLTAVRQQIRPRELAGAQPQK